jgi:hypothetical protein
VSLLPPEATFAEVVQEAFLRLKGKGLMLGALDAELLSAWSARRRGRALTPSRANSARAA